MKHHKEASIFEGKVIVFTAPSGAGKTTIVRHLIETFPNEIAFSISATSRQIRPSESNGVDYYFLSSSDFQSRIDNGDFLEWEEVYEGLMYGTLYSEIHRIWAEEKHIIFDVDVHGASAIKKHFGDQCLAIFIRPPSLQILINRLKKRNTETPSSLRKRIDRVKEELTFEYRFDKILVNDILEVALKEAEVMVEEFILT